MISQFKNELGNDIVIKVNSDDRGVHISIAGPDSIATNTLTRKEAINLGQTLVQFFMS